MQVDGYQFGPFELELDPSCGSALAILAESRFRFAGRIEEGVRHLEKARSLDPLSLHINSDLGALLYEAGRRDEAVAQFDRTLELDPRYAKTHFLLGHVHLAEGNVAEALDSFERSVAFSPETPKYRSAYVAALARLA